MKITHRLMRNEGWVRWHPQRLAEISISYCDENCISINGCCRHYLPRVACDSIIQQVVWWGPDRLGMAAGASTPHPPPQSPGDAANEQRRPFGASELGGPSTYITVI